MNNIREHLCSEAAAITDAAGRRFSTRESLIAAVPAMREQFLEMMGICDLAPAGLRSAPPAVVSAVSGRGGIRVERLHYQSLPRLYVTANLYLPAAAARPAPAVLYVCGHSAEQKFHFQTHCWRWAELGFAVLVLDTVEYGEIKGVHHGTYAKGWFNWCSRGYTPAGVELLNAIRGVDYLCSRAEIASDRIGVTGISGGGATSWWLGAADERVKAVAPVCGTGTLRAHLADRTLDGHCDCMYFVNYFRWDLADLGALIAPRPLLIASADRDVIFSVASVRECHERAGVAYGLMGAADRIRLLETPGPHSYHETSRRAVFSFFLRHLAGKEAPPEALEDVREDDRLPARDLTVFAGGLPADHRNGSIQDSFVPAAAPPDIRTAAQLADERGRAVAWLRSRTFNHFPPRPCPLDCRTEQEFSTAELAGRRVSFVPEDGWRLAGRVLSRAGGSGRKGTVVVVVRGPHQGQTAAMGLWDRITPDCHRLEFEPRGVGGTSWGKELCWHVRRGCAATGRTVASMRVYDALRAMELARSLPECDGSVAIGGQGEMAVVALYAALLDGGARSVILVEPPATLQSPSAADGSGDAIEMLGALRCADVQVAAGLLYPAELVFKLESALSYSWTEELYARLGPPGRITQVNRLSEWRP